MEWSRLNPYDTLGLTPAVGPAATSPAPGIARSSGPGVADGLPKPWQPDNPLFWFGLIAAATFGLVAVSTSIRIGPAHAGAGLGKK